MPKKGEPPTPAQIAALERGRAAKAARQAERTASKKKQTARAKGADLDEELPSGDDLGPTARVVGHAPEPPAGVNAAPPPPEPPTPPAPASSPKASRTKGSKKPDAPSGVSPDAPDDAGRSPDESSRKPGSFGRRLFGGIHRGLGG